MAEAGGMQMLVFCFLGIFGCYFVYGVLQETITKAKYGDKGEKFQYTLSLVFVQCIINALFAKIGMVATKERDRTPGRLYALCSLSYLGAMLASNHSLQHVTYPTQVLGKSIKPIPVMILGVLVAGKRYALAKYLFVLMIVMGVALFMYKDQKNPLPPPPLKITMLWALERSCWASQDKMRGEHSTGATGMMFNINLYSILWLAIGLLATGEIFEFLPFVSRYPHVLINMLLFSLSSAAGQMFIFKTVTTFGPLTCSIFTTTRKFFTILCSIAYFGHPMTGRQWLGTVLVFMGLTLDNIYGKALKKTEKTS